MTSLTKNINKFSTKGSKIGRLPIVIPADIVVVVDNNHVSVQGPKGKLQKSFHSSVQIRVEKDHIYFDPVDNSRLAKSMHGTARAIVQNMINGVKDLFVKNLVVVGTGYKVALKGNVLELLLGKSHPDTYTIPSGITVTVTDNTKIKIEGIDCQKVGQVAADIYHFKKPDAYKGKGVQDGRVLHLKDGKKTA